MSRRDETLAIPRSIRDAVDARDQGYCRVCGKFVGEGRALHHINFSGDERGMGGRRVHEVDGLVTVCWMWAGNCHERVHRDKNVWKELLREVINRPGLTAMQLRRWRAAASRRRTS